MAVIAPNSDLILLKVPLEIDEANQLTFSNATAQFNYFNGLSDKLVVEKYSYQRKDGTIRFGANFDDIIEYNYVMYRNTSYSNKWFYAFIENMEYHTGKHFVAGGMCSCSNHRNIYGSTILHNG